MPTITGTTGNDTLTILTDTSSVQAGAGTDTVVFTGDIDQLVKLYFLTSREV